MGGARLQGRRRTLSEIAEGAFFRIGLPARDARHFLRPRVALASRRQSGATGDGQQGDANHDPQIAKGPPSTQARGLADGHAFSTVLRAQCAHPSIDDASIPSLNR